MYSCKKINAAPLTIFGGVADFARVQTEDNSSPGIDSSNFQVGIDSVWVISIGENVQMQD